MKLAICGFTVKQHNEYHRICLAENGTLLTVVRGGPRRAYLWIAPRSREGFGGVRYLCRTALLRKIALAILAEVGGKAG